jgi:hypothetical protein
MKMKKIFIIASVLLVVVLIFLGIYNFAFKKSKTVVQETTAIEPIKNTVPIVVSEKITPISDGGVLGVYLDKKTQELKYYDAATGLVWRTDVEGQKKQQITMTKVIGLKQVTWSADGSKALTMIQKNGVNNFYEYDYSLQKSTLLKDGLDSVSWDNVGKKIFYKYFDKVSNKRTLNIANPDGSGWEKLGDIIDRNIIIAPIPFTSMISYWSFPNAAEETHLKVIGAIGGEAKTILNGRYGADYIWAPDGSKALVSSLSSKGGSAVVLGVVTIDGEYSDLGIPTLASKSTWSADSKNVYYALPGEIPDNAKMPNDYQENKFNTSDTFWKMEIATGEKSRIIETNVIKGKYDSSNMILSADEKTLYFINKVDQKLYKIALQ